MFKAGRWRSEKNRIKVVFRLQFQATQVPPSKWENLVITLIPGDAGKPTARSEKAAVSGGTCRWDKPIYETVKFVREPKTGKIGEKVYHIIVSGAGLPKEEALLGEATIDFAGYAEEIKPLSLSLPLKAFGSDVVLHVTLQRAQDELRRREIEGNGETKGKPQRRTLMSQLSNSDGGEEPENTGEINGFPNSEKSTADGERMKFPSARAVVHDVEFSPNLRTSRSFDAVSVTWSDDTSSGRYTPGDGARKTSIFRQDSTSLLSPLGNNGTPQRPSMFSPVDYGDDRRSTVESTELGAGHSDESSSELKNEFVTLARQIEVSDLELQALRKQVVKERKLVTDLSKDLRSVKEERDKFKRECDELMASRGEKGDGWDVEREKLRSMLDEVKQEADHEKSRNANLCLQLKKMQDSNSELMLEIRDLDEMLAQKNREESNGGSDGNHEKKQGGRFSYLQRLKGFGGALKNVEEEEDEEQCALEALVNEREVKTTLSLEQKIMELNNEIEMHRRDREELEIQMEQLALDYEILKQENHDISSKLEQTQLREQLRMQYECSAHVSIINELEGQVEKLEAELEKQAEAFENDLTALTSAKVGQEKRAIELEEELRKAKLKNVKAAEHLMEELERISVQMSSMLGKKEKLAMQALAEASQLRLRNSQLEELLEKAVQSAAAAEDHHRSQVEEFESEVALSKGHIERLYLKLREKSEELERENGSKVEEGASSSGEISRLKACIESLEKEKSDLHQQLKRRVELGTFESTGQLLPNGNIKREVFHGECTSRKEEEKSNGANKPRLEKKDEAFGNRTPRTEMEKRSLSSLFEKDQERIVEKQEEADPSIMSSGDSEDSSSERCLIKEAMDSRLGSDDEILLSPKPEGRRLANAKDEMEKESIASKTRSHYLTQREASNGLPSDQGSPAESVSETTKLRDINKSMEAELKEMQERYSELSLKFAQVEGDRQQLVMTVRTLKNTLKS